MAARRRRRAAYAGFRAAYVAWRTLGREAAAWHAAVAIAASLACALVIVHFGPRFHVPVTLYLAPIFVAVGYAVALTAVRYRRTWSQFAELRRHMRLRRMHRLHRGGYAMRHFERTTYVRVTLPTVSLAIIGILLAARLFPSRDDWRGMVMILIVSILVLGARVVLGRWNEQFRPRDINRLCPRCGYDLTGSADRCPECGMRRLRDRGGRHSDCDDG